MALPDDLVEQSIPSILVILHVKHVHDDELVVWIRHFQVVVHAYDYLAKVQHLSGEFHAVQELAFIGMVFFLWFPFDGHTHQALF